MAWIFRLLGVTFILLLAQSILYKKAGLHGISILRSFSSAYSSEGDEVYLLEEIVNNRPLPVPLLVVESRIHKNLELSSAIEQDSNQTNYHRSIFSMLPFSKIVRKHKVKLLKRGYYEISSVAASTNDLLGFSKVFEDQLPVNASISVYPKFIEPNSMQLPSHSFLGDLVVKRWIVDDPFISSGVRDYQSSDPMKNINWKATAHTGALKINAHDFTANTKLLILFNTDISENQWDSVLDTALLEKGLSIVATFAKVALENGIETAFSSNAQNQFKRGCYSETGFGSGNQQLYTILEELSLLIFKHLTSFQYFLSELQKQENQQIDILIITAYIDEEINSQINLIRASGNSVEIFRLEEGNKVE